MVIEIDGPYHLNREKIEYDEDRTELFNNFQIKVIRFTNFQVLNKISFVLVEIIKHIEDLSNPQD